MEATARRPISRYFLVVVFLLSGILLFARAMDRDLNHDEHQFLTPGALLTRQHLLPYRDYPLFHLPNLTYIYGSLLQVTDYYVLAAKSLSVLASTAVLGIILVRATRRSTFGSDNWALPIGVALTVLLLTDPLFLWTSGKTWNHELPTMFLMVGYLCQLAAVRSNSLLFSGFAGFMVSMAIGTRLTIAPAVVPFLGSLFFIPGVTASRRLAHFASFAGAGVAAAAPTLLALYTARDAFLFDNLQFPRLRLLDVSDIRAADTVTWWRKIRYFVKEIVLPGYKDGQFRGSLLVAIPFAALSIPIAWRWLRTRELKQFPVAFSAVLVLFIGLGCALPTRYQYQHWFIVVPFALLATAEAIQFSGPGNRSWKPWGLSALAIASLLMNGKALAEPLAVLFKPEEWFPVRLHTYGQEIRSHVPSGKVLTLAPAYVDEAGLPTYPTFATGPFAWRLAHLLDPSTRQRFRLTSPADLESLLEKDPPAAILTKVEEDALESPLIEYAKAHGFERVRLKKGRELWIKPMPAPL